MIAVRPAYSMVKSKTTLAECGFLKGIGAVRLRRMHKGKENPKARDRLRAYAMRKERMSVYAISGSLDRPYLPYATGWGGQ